MWTLEKWIMWIALTQSTSGVATTTFPPCQGNYHRLRPDCDGTVQCGDGLESTITVTASDSETELLPEIRKKFDGNRGDAGVWPCATPAHGNQQQNCSQQVKNKSMGDNQQKKKRWMFHASKFCKM